MSAAELRKAVFEALVEGATPRALMGGRLIDQAAPNGVFPSIGFGSTALYDWSSGAETGERLVTLHVWSKANDGEETAGIMEEVRAKLAGSLLDLDDGERAMVRLEFSEARFDEDLLLHHGILRFRVATEEEPS